MLIVSVYELSLADVLQKSKDFSRNLKRGEVRKLRKNRKDSLGKLLERENKFILMENPSALKSHK